MIIADSAPDRRAPLPAGRRTATPCRRCASPIQPSAFALGYVTLDPDGGQVPWHNQAQEEVYFVIEGDGEMCLGGERGLLGADKPFTSRRTCFTRLTNTGTVPLRLLYCYGPAGDVAHWRQELDGTLPRAGADAPPLPADARPQRI